MTKLSLVYRAVCYYEAEGHYHIMVTDMDDGTVASIRDAVTDKLIFDMIPIMYMTVNGPEVTLFTKSQ